MQHQTKPFTSILDLVGVDATAAILAEFLRSYPGASSEYAARVARSLDEFFGRHAALIAPVLTKHQLARTDPEYVRSFLGHALPRLPLIEQTYLRSLLEQLECADAAPPKTLKVKIVSAPQRHLTISQRRAADTLQRYARIYFERPEFRGVRLRAQPLIVGPSGVGKTFLVQDLARTLHLPLCKQTVGEWLPAGSRGESNTLVAIKRFVETHEQGVIHLDELDKYASSRDGAWMVCVMAEVFTLLDRQPAGWKPEMTTKLRERFLLIGSGTWQDIWDLPQPTPIGFTSSHLSHEDADRRFISRVRAARMIPPELLNRFNESWIILNPYTAADFSALSKALDLPPGALDIDEAVRSRLNFRALESSLTRFAMAQLDCSGAVRPERNGCSIATAP